MNDKTIVLCAGHKSYDIQKEVQKLQSFKNLDQWAAHLEEVGRNHRAYYHYTTLSTLKNILCSSYWRLRRADCSNDPQETSVHNASFTVWQLSSMGMWYQYSKLDRKNDIGVRIRIPKETMLEIFSRKNLFRQEQDGSYEKIRNAPKVKITDMAYWHFGSDAAGKKDRLFYKGYIFPFCALAENKFQRPARKLSPCFKGAVWRSEMETRVYCDFGEKRKETVPMDIYAAITPEQFRKMEFWLAPGFAPDRIASKFTDQTCLMNLISFFGMELLTGNKIRPEQFHLPSEQEEWQDESEQEKS